MTDVVNTRPVGQRLQRSVLTGRDKTLTVPTGKRWTVINLQCTGSTSATVGNRQFVAQINDGGVNQIWTLAALATVAASQTFYWQGAAHPYSTASGRGGTGFNVLDYIPTGFIMESGYRFQFTETANVDAADNVYLNYEIIEEVV